MSAAARQCAPAYGPWVDRLVGPCPVHPLKRVQVQFRGETRGEAESNQHPFGMPAHLFTWAIENHRGDIVACREVLR
jgi:hypothetical protein